MLQMEYVSQDLSLSLMLQGWSILHQLRVLLIIIKPPRLFILDHRHVFGDKPPVQRIETKLVWHRMGNI